MQLLPRRLGFRTGGTAVRTVKLALVAIATGAGLVACDRIKNPLLSVDTPDIVTPDKATSAAGAQSFFIAAQGDFARLVGGDRGGSSPLGLNLTGGLLADALHSQVDLHALYGGVVPELASRDHVQRLLPLLRDVLERSG